MVLSRRHKYTLGMLCFYWLVLFVLTHIPVPDIAGRSGMSDKTMHVLAYFALTFLLWFVLSPHRKVDWRKYKVWLILVAVVLYGVIDEWLQGYVGRSTDSHDFFADLAGSVLCVLMLSVLSFWPGLLMMAAGFIFSVTNLSSIAVIYPNLHLNAAFHFLGYGTFTLLWIQIMDRYTVAWFAWKWGIAIAAGLPVLLLLAVKLSSPVFNRQSHLTDYLTAITAIAAAVGISFAIKTLGKTPDFTP